MSTTKSTHHLSIYLIKPEYTTTAQVLKTDGCGVAIDIPIAGAVTGQLFMKRTNPRPPRWAKLFVGHLDPFSIVATSISAALFVAVGARRFVLVFGQGGRFLLHDDVFEERFGLRCALNAVDPETFRCVDVQSLDAIDSHTRIQSGQGTTADQFGLNVEQDMLKAIVGRPKDQSLGTQMTGADSLVVSVKMNLADLPALLDAYRVKFEEAPSSERYQWINNIAVVKNKGLIDRLESLLDTRLAAGTFEHLWLSIPEIIDWTLVRGFMYDRRRRLIYSDITLAGFRESLKEGTKVTVELLRNRTVYCADAEHNPVFRSWPVYRCLYAEIDLDGSKYILNDGKWFNVAANFVAGVDRLYESISSSVLSLPKYTGGGEGAYNASVALAEPGRYALLDDKKKVMHGGAHGQVEICDLFSIDRHLIHVKMYGKSSVLSHLFAQGFVSGELIQLDQDFRKKVRDRLVPPFSSLITVESRPRTGELTIVYAVISHVAGDRLYLPFFSRVNLNNTRRILEGYGYKVELLKIEDDTGSATTGKAPPKRPRSRRAFV